MKRHYKTDSSLGVPLGVMQATYEVPSSQDLNLRVSTEFRKIMSKAGFPENRADKDHPFGWETAFAFVNDEKFKSGMGGICEIEPRHFSRKGERIGKKGYAMVNAHFDPANIGEVLLIAVQGMYVGKNKLNNILDSFAQDTDLKEVDIPPKILRRLETVDFQWANRLKELKQFY